MRRFVLSLIVLWAAASEKSTAQDLGSPDSPTGGLQGVYAPPESAPGQLRGVYRPSRALAATPLSTRLSASANSSLDNVPSVSIPVDSDGQSLPQSVQASPMPDRPGYGRARVNGHLAIIDLNGNRIVQFLDPPGQLGGAVGTAPSSAGRGLRCADARLHAPLVNARPAKPSLVHARRVKQFEQFQYRGRARRNPACWRPDDTIALRRQRLRPGVDQRSNDVVRQEQQPHCRDPALAGLQFLGREVISRYSWRRHHRRPGGMVNPARPPRSRTTKTISTLAAGRPKLNSLCLRGRTHCNCCSAMRTKSRIRRHGA